MFENGEMKLHELVSSEPDILKGVIIGKKSWGLWMREWSEGVGDGLFNKWEILEEFEKRDITIPDPFLLDFNNSIKRRILKNTKKDL